jgi:dCMP deaminase
MLTNAKIKRYVSFGEYNDKAFLELFQEAGIAFDLKKRPPSKITYLD